MSSAGIWTIILCLSAFGWLLMWFFTKPKGGKKNDKDD